jgi:hypothetical protein
MLPAVVGKNAAGPGTERTSGMAFGYCCVLALALLMLTPTPARAGSDVSLTYNSAPDDYRSHAFAANVDLFSLPLQATFDYLSATANDAEVTREAGIGLKWRATDWLSASYRYSRVTEEIFDVKGKEALLGFNLNKIWKSELGTRLDIGYGEYIYTANVGRPAVQAFIANLMPDQKRYRLGLSQDITQDLTIYAVHDAYRYTKDPVTLARFLNRRPRINSSRVSVLLAFPDRTNTLGVTWSAASKITLDASYADTRTVVDQKLETSQITVTYRPVSSTSISLGVSRGTASAVRNAAGNIVISESAGTSWTASVGYEF